MTCSNATLLLDICVINKQGNIYIGYYIYVANPRNSKQQELNKNDRKVKVLNRLQWFVQKNAFDLSVVRSLDRVILKGICSKYNEQYLVGQPHVNVKFMTFNR